MNVRVGGEVRKSKGRHKGRNVESATADANGAHFREKTEKGGGQGDAVGDERAR